MPVQLSLDCPTCAHPRPFEQPPCADGHGADCPEWACVDCGTALLLGPVPVPEPDGLGTGRRAA